jgi:hypothetical protein
LRLLPPVEALLIINTWPLLIILLTASCPAESACSPPPHRAA